MPNNPNNPSNQNNPNRYDTDDQRKKDAGRQMGDKDQSTRPRDGQKDQHDQHGQHGQQGQRDDKDFGRKGNQH
ncbi:MAG: hypothetical protein HY243_14095 [Proteobacteria bacterium]|nr:hypothetical protein [Pseudomonadota bacterium]